LPYGRSLLSVVYVNSDHVIVSV